jgi:hypothetical protein
MSKPATIPTPIPVAKTLAEQKSDFTAEGSPPPGKVTESKPIAKPEPARSTSPSGPSGQRPS